MTDFCFKPADILLPKKDFSEWAVIACDQFTSEPSYWEEVEKTVGEHPSTLSITLPEIYLGGEDVEDRIRNINETMERYLKDDILKCYPHSMIYVERTQSDGKIRHGIIGSIRLKDYDYRRGARTMIRATELTVVERIPPRVKIRKDAPLELPHVMLLMDDPRKTVIEPITARKDELEVVYDFDLMAQGGHIKGYLLTEALAEQVQITMATLVAGQDEPLLFAVGDGNHSLATAKECSFLNENELSDEALVEVVNIHDDAIEFEPIYRIVFHVDEEQLVNEFLAQNGDDYMGSDAQTFTILYHGNVRTVSVRPTSSLPVGTVQGFLDRYLRSHPEAKIDYIHGIESVRSLCKPQGTVAFLFDGMAKEQLFPAVEKDGSLPRKTFSMGHARDKRYYIEARKIK